MGWWLVNADTLAGSRFVISALAEATGCLLALERGSPRHPGERAWLDAHRPAYLERLAADPVTATLVKTAYGPRWIADFLTIAPPIEDVVAFHDELARIRATPAAAVGADLEVSNNSPLPALLRHSPDQAAESPPRPDLPERMADLLDWIWTATVLPYWPRRRRMFEADIVARTERLGKGGWAAALGDMRQGMRWLGEGRLQINTYDYPPREISGSQLLFVPVSRGRGWVAWTPPNRYAIMYPCAGALAEAGRAPTPEGLGRLLGAARAEVLVLLDTPKSTTQLVALTGQALGSVGRHLKVLHDAQLVRRRRAGRSVLYYRTAAGDGLVAAQDDALR
ncbi:MAG TPA: helix-turn-helix domain-containing protein [Streptosporangiaceae bacterium]|jgi:DNA-binding transcriptional ArsR family regulator